ncbi:hypothetical protein, unlikely [Trypanosoma brucei gambiense DAL972]|uniref:Uncharacterized protein n=1 Tax=Trypanosoma brucei gambiense (strain MHOM/CI/86/DAL972) TaxID=679716 RepID=C9ZRN2_TRYB9|nr:hypothetical protein, unlikely [Trypanosoma brucei gambiense DAL972]CBH12334.1 hypothetical protein, unlikely [Trypanosoma brucei gambiense DAL972]|eukprot:XP_011774615.1 hypothetical protein, unlikely [Trypanosoma brucei gambiense DAL972]
MIEWCKEKCSPSIRLFIYVRLSFFFLKGFFSVFPPDRIRSEVLDRFVFSFYGKKQKKGGRENEAERNGTSRPQEMASMQIIVSLPFFSVAVFVLRRGKFFFFFFFNCLWLFRPLYSFLSFKTTVLHHFFFYSPFSFRAKVSPGVVLSSSCVSLYIRGQNEGNYVFSLRH